MSKHAYQLDGVNLKQLQRQLKTGAVVAIDSNVNPSVVTVNLTDDGDKEDLDSYMESIGFVFVPP